MTDVQQARIEAAAKVFYESQGGANYETSLYRDNWYAIAKRALAAADAVVSVEAIIGVLDHEGAQCGNCGREPGDPADCTDCARVLARYAAAIQRLYRGEAGAVQCDQHKPVQHRDGKPPWCRACGKTAANTAPGSRFSGEAGV